MTGGHIQKRIARVIKLRSRQRPAFGAPSAELMAILATLESMTKQQLAEFADAVGRKSSS